MVRRERLVVEMKGMVLAGGTGSRLMPLTMMINKHLLPVYNQPMIYHPLGTLIESGIRDIMIVSGREHAGQFIEMLGSGEDLGVELTYRVQEEAGGIAEAIWLGKEWMDDQDFTVILGDNIFQDSFDLRLKGAGAKLFLKSVRMPARFGVPVFNTDKSIQYIEEKPVFPKSQFAVTGLYVYDRKVFSYIEQSKRSARNELEITDVNNQYISQQDLEYEIVHGFWSDAGTFDSLLDASQMVRGCK